MKVSVPLWLRAWSRCRAHPEVDALRAQLFADVPAGCGGDGAGVGDDGSRLRALDHAVRAGQHIFRHLGVAHAEEDELRLFGHLFGRSAGNAFFLLRELLRFARGVRPQRHLMTARSRFRAIG